jgi:beta-lactam-binding protein with PASTA domain
MFGFGFVWWLLRWSFAVCVFIAIMAASGYYVFNEAVAGREYVTVPDIVNRPYQDAVDTLNRNNLEMGTQTPIQISGYPENYVRYQSPPAGKVVRAGRKVYPTVSRQDRVVVPDVNGMGLDEAETALVQARLRLDTTIARVRNAAQAGTVINQDPQAGKEVPIESLVRLLISEGGGEETAKVYMPDLIGLTPEEAEAELKPLQVDAKAIKIDGAEPPFNEIISQRPEAGMLLRPGDMVTYEFRANAPVEGAWRKVTVEYTVPPPRWVEREVKMIVEYQDGTRRKAFPPPEFYVDGLPPKYAGESKISQPISFQNEISVEVYLDGELARSYHYTGDAAPVIRDYGEASGEPSSAGT